MAGHARGGLLIGVAAGLGLAACSHAIPLKPTVEASTATEPVAETVGVYYSPQLQAHEHRGSQYGDTWVFPLGPASVELFDQTFPQVFRDTLRVQSLPPLGAEYADLAAVIEPRIEEFAFHLPFIKSGTYTAEITYRLILYSMRGDPVASWTVRGYGAQAGQLGFEFARWPGEATDLAMQDAARQFVDGFTSVPEVRRWLRSRGALISLGPTTAPAAHIEGSFE